MTKHFFRTILEVEVLTEEPLEWDNLSDVHYAITAGDASGRVTEKKRETITPEHAALALLEHGSSPAFFDL